MAKKTNEFGDMLRELRKSRKVPLGTMADYLKVAPSYLSDVELGRRYPFRRETLENCKRVLNLGDAEFSGLLTAASTKRGGVELQVESGNKSQVEALTALDREWPALSQDENALKRMTEWLDDYRSSKK